MAALGERFNVNAEEALALATAVGFILAWELRVHGVDLSFTPVLDLDYGRSAVIGNRAFHRNAEVVAQLAAAHCVGLHQAGFAAVGKHFPGHGFVEADSHHDLPVDPRSFSEIDQEDIEPFRRLMGSGLEGIMPAHIRYARVDDKPACFSPFWLQQVLRGQLGFDGVIFSDDLSMKGALGEGGPAQRAHAAMVAGCDMVLLCNDSVAAQELVQGLEGFNWSVASAQRLKRMMSLPAPSAADGQAYYETAQARLRPFLNSLS
jgi:beta-N-acetylhexosaminidase